MNILTSNVLSKNRKGQLFQIHNYMSQEHEELIDYTELYTATTLPYEESPGETHYYTTDNPGDCIYYN